MKTSCLQSDGLTNTVLMVRPAHFNFNEQTAASNAFQQQSSSKESADNIQTKALVEFDRLVTQLEAAGIRVLVFEDTSEPRTPDAIFPNNWVSFHENGQVVLYPMAAPNRRLERRLDIIKALDEQHGFEVREIVDFAPVHEELGWFLEGTGSLVLDRVNKMAYACISDRTHLKAIKKWEKLMNYKKVWWVPASDMDKKPIYHTNVLMALGDAFAVIGSVAISNRKRRGMMFKDLEATGHEIIRISREQMSAFAGNMLQLRNQMGEKILVMSKTAHNALTQDQIECLEDYNDRFLLADIPTIEHYGGGSVRCMLAAMYLPEKVEGVDGKGLESWKVERLES